MTPVEALVDGVLAVLVLEVVVLLFVAGRPPRLARAARLLPNLAAGLFLVLALRCAVHGTGTFAITLFVALGGVAHVLDLRSRVVR